VHEASIAIELAQLASEQALLNNARRILKVGVRIGSLSSVIPEALEFAWTESSADTLAAGSRLEIERIAARGICVNHGEIALELARGLRCPICDAPTPNITQGEELELDTLELED
jgi:hydrogenase nickel incorporation protein HypA/HybF